MSEEPIEPRVVRLETQVGRIVSDIESEKRTRASVHSDLFKRILALEKGQWVLVGVGCTLQIVLTVFLAIFLKK